MKKTHARRLIPILLLAAALVGAAVVHAQSVTVRVGSAESPDGAVAEVPVTLEGSPGISALHLELTYDPAMLAVESVEAGDLVAGNALTAFNTDEPGRIVISLAAADQIAGDGALVVARFLVSGDKGQASALNLEFPQAWDGDGFEVGVELEAGQITVASSGQPLWLLAVLVLLILVLILLVVFLLARRGRKRTPAAPTYADPMAWEEETWQDEAWQDEIPRQRPPSPGRPAPGRKFCGYCGQSLEPGKGFCTHCGQPVDG